MTSPTVKALYFLAILFSGLALGPALAHLFALPNKFDLDEAQYFTVQQIYRGWALLGVIVIGALVATGALALALRHQPSARLGAVIAFLCIAGTQLIFWSFTFPANRATLNWSAMPVNWEALRTQWEYSHAASALLNIGALIALALSVLSWADAARRRRG